MRNETLPSEALPRILPSAPEHVPIASSRSVMRGLVPRIPRLSALKNVDWRTASSFMSLYTPSGNLCRPTVNTAKIQEAFRRAAELGFVLQNWGAVFWFSSNRRIHVCHSRPSRALGEAPPQILPLALVIRSARGAVPPRRRLFLFTPSRLIRQILTAAAVYRMPMLFFAQTKDGRTKYRHDQHALLRIPFLTVRVALVTSLP
jgi:hypothetical protein